jgi:hypothetical protein
MSSTAGVLASVGLFDEASHDAEPKWPRIGFHRQIRLRGKQRDGADDYTKYQLRLIKGGAGMFTTSRLWTADLPALAGRIEDEQRAFRSDQGQPYRFKGYVLGIEHLGQRKMSAGFVPWLPK